MQHNDKVSTKSKTFQAFEKQNYYERLGLVLDATNEQIRAAYKKMALKYHPDKNPSEEARYEFGLITEAYETLNDTALKIKYDIYISLQKGRGNVPFRVINKKKETFKKEHWSGEIHHIAIKNNYVAIPLSTEIQFYYLYYNSNGLGLNRRIAIKQGDKDLYKNVTISETENLLYATTPYGIKAFSLETGKLVKEFKGLTKLHSSTAAVIVNKDKGTYVYDGEKRLIKIDQKGKVVQEILVGSVKKITLSSDGKYVIVSGSYPKGVFVYDIETGKLINTFKTRYNVYYAEMSPDGQFIACAGGGYSDTVSLYNIITGQCQEILVNGNIGNTLHSLNFSPNSKYIVIGEWSYGYSIYGIDEHKIFYREKIPGKIQDVFFSNNRIIINNGKDIYNVPVPMDITIESHLIGADDVHLALEHSFTPKYDLPENKEINNENIHSPLNNDNADSKKRPLVAPDVPPVSPLMQFTHQAKHRFKELFTRENALLQKCNELAVIDRTANDVSEQVNVIKDEATELLKHKAACTQFIQQWENSNPNTIQQNKVDAIKKGIKGEMNWHLTKINQLIKLTMEIPEIERDFLSENEHEKVCGPIFKKIKNDILRSQNLEKLKENTRFTQKEKLFDLYLKKIKKAANLAELKRAIVDDPAYTDSNLSLGSNFKSFASFGLYSSFFKYKDASGSFLDLRSTSEKYMFRVKDQFAQMIRKELDQINKIPNNSETQSRSSSRKLL